MPTRVEWSTCASRQGTCRALQSHQSLSCLKSCSKLTALVPTLDDLTLANVEAQRLTSVVTGIEFLATILESTTVVDLNLVTF